MYQNIYDRLMFFLLFIGELSKHSIFTVNLCTVINVENDL